jgi:hypothetical protein
MTRINHGTGFSFALSSAPGALWQIDDALSVKSGVTIGHG